MELNVKMYPDKFCRACLNESSEMTALSAKIEGENRTLFEVLSFVTNINIIPRNGLPRQVCSECESILYKADAFKRRCLKSEAILSHQYNTTIEGHFNLQLSEQTLVKDENAIELDESDLLRPSQSSVSLVKPLNTNLDAIFDTIPEKDEKGKIFDDISSTNLDKHFCEETKHIIPKESITQSVKEEDSSDFDSQNDMLFDFEETNAFETLPIETEQKMSTIKNSKPLTCVCGTVFKKKNEYKMHLRTKKCKENKKSSKIKLENQHSKNSHERKKKPIKCPDCNIEFATVKACKIHQRKHRETDDTGNFECSMCMRKFCRKSSYTNHMKQHDLKSSVKYTCETCKRDFQHKAHLDNHILALHSRDKGFLCEVCMTYFATQESLDIHKESHKIEKKHQCHICKKGFYMLSTLNDHLRVHTGEKPFLCSICGRGFSQKTNLAQHMRRHQGLKPFKCEDCNKRFVSKGELVAHNRKHSGAHPFVCDDCGSGFTTSSSLVKHRRVHTGERPYACDLCPMRFAASGTLKNHRRTHTGEKPFQCSYCEKAFVQRHDLIAHIRGHTGERPYTCGCGQAFRKASALKAHVRLHGKEPQRELTLLQHTSVMLHGEANIISEHTSTV